MKLFAPLSLAIALSCTSCITTGVTPCGPDTYTVSSQGVGFSDGGTRARVYKKANKFCEDRGLVMVPIAIDSERGQFARSEPNTNLTFLALKPGDPAIRRTNIDAPDYTLRVQHR